MSTDFSLKEREFVDALASETGRDLAQWMAAITASGHAHRNDIIDWLRQQGFTFAKASWLERIHHNGGVLIYGPSAAARAPTASAPRKPKAAEQAKPATSRDGPIDDLLAGAKAYRPLAHLLLREVLSAVPGADAEAIGPLVVFAHTSPFAALAPSPKDVRLLLACGSINPGEPWLRAKGFAAPASLTHMLSVTDARQVTAELKRLIAECARAA